MAKRTQRVSQVEKTKDRIQAGRLISYLQEHAEGKREMTATQVKAAEILIKRVVPELKSIEHTGEGGGPVHTVINARAPMTNEEWEAAYGEPVEVGKEADD